MRSVFERIGRVQRWRSERGRWGAIGFGLVALCVLMTVANARAMADPTVPQAAVELSPTPEGQPAKPFTAMGSATSAITTPTNDQGYPAIAHSGESDPVLSGRVYEGDVGVETNPLSGVTVELYYSNDVGVLGTLIDSTTTDSVGWYGLTASGAWEYYNILETHLPGYTSVGATSVHGVPVTENWIQYEYPLEGKTFTGNKFWDEQLVLSGRVHKGEVGDESTPLGDVTVELYCSNDVGVLGTLIDSTTTDSVGWYGLTAPGVCEYYNILETDLPGYTSVGAASVDGVAITQNWIQYAYPLEGKMLTGNKFWDEQLVLSGRVYKGEVGDESTPLGDVTVELYCSNDVGVLGTLIDSTTTDSVGWYGLAASGVCEYYNILETDLPGYTSVGATSVHGVPVTDNWIQYEYPLEGKTLTGNKFWDEQLVLSGRVYEGDVGDHSTPLSGVTVELYCSNDEFVLGDVITTTATSGEGWYELPLSGGWEFYNILQTDLPGYTSVGASTEGGLVITEDWIQYVGPVEGKILTDNYFWDITEEQYILSGRVYEGDVGDQSTPLSGVTVELYCSNDEFVLGDVITTTVTNGEGWYELPVPGGWEFYNILETDLPGYTSVGATSVGGTPNPDNPNWIQYVSPLQGKILTANYFWDGAVTRLPDLIVTDQWNEGNSICFQVRNVGDEVAIGGHEVALFVDGDYARGRLVEVDLEPGARWGGCFDYGWECTPFEDSIAVFADHGSALAESDETNNLREEFWQCDTMPPEIIGGPTVSEVTQNSGLISWETNEESNSVVRHGVMASLYPFEATEPNFVVTHSVALEDLEPSTTYNFRVQSTDAGGNSVESRVRTFETLAMPDHVDPVVDITDPGVCTGVYTFTATASDNTGVEKVQFWFDGEPAFTDFSPPYQFISDTIAYDNGPHMIAAMAYDLSGRSIVDEQAIEIANPIDVTVPSVAITSPGAGDTVSGTITITATLTDDIGLADAVFLVDAVQIGFIPFPAHTPTATAQLSWDTTLVTNGAHPIKVKAYDIEGKTDSDTLVVIVDNPSPPPQPALIITEHKATRSGNGFVIELTVKNAGLSEAKNVYIQDYSRSFQAISRNTTTPVLAEYKARFNPSDMSGDCDITDYIDLSPGLSRTYSYSLMPVAVHPNPPTPLLGHITRLWYEGPDGTKHYQEFKIKVLQTVGGESVATAYAKALKSADYLIVTHPQRLFSHYMWHDVDDLLSNMAQLAVYELGALGYLDTYDKYIFDKLIEPGASWAKKLSPSFSQPLGGYLLIVGETEIVGAWTQGGFSIGWNPVKYSDHPYADTGDTPAPDLIVGRIIGDSAAALSKPIEASIGVYEGSPGYDFDRDNATVISGPGFGSFVQDVEQVDTILQSEFTVKKNHCRDYFFVSSFSRAYEKHDGFALGDVIGDSKHEIVIGARSTGKIYVYNENGTQLSEFYCGYGGNEFEEGDKIAVGDSKIVMADSSANRMLVYDSSGVLQTSFGVDFEAFDGLAAGDLTGDSSDEIVIADKSANKIYLYTMSGVKLSDEVSRDYDKYDGLAVGDVLGDSKEEIVIADRSANKILIYSANGTLQGSRQFATKTVGGKTINWLEYIDYDIIEATDVGGSALAVGQLYPWPSGNDNQKEEILIAPALNYQHIMVYWWDVNVLRDTGPIPFNFDQFDGLATGEIGNILGKVQDEVFVADRDNYVRTLDTNNWLSRFHTALPGFTRDADVIFLSGHGNVDGCCGISSYRDPIFPLDFNNHNPFVLATSCLTGNYEDGADKINIAESFLASGAAVYIGATQSSNGYENREGAKWFYKNWGPYESIGEVFTKLEQSVWKGSTTDNWWFWVWEHNLYGNPKFGAEPPGSAGGVQMLTEPLTPPSSLQIEIPDYVVTTTLGLDWVEIPGGRLWLEAGQLWVPFYSASIDYPQGHKVQDVTLVERSGLIADTGLNIPITPEDISPCLCDPQPAPGAGDGWFPQEVYRWEALENPDGSATLVITMYPFYYNAQTTDVRFYKNYSFDISYSVSPVIVTSLTTDKDAYEQGDTVMVDIDLNNTAEAQAVVFSALIREYGSDEIADGLLLQTLQGFSGLASFSPDWDSSGFASGYYYVEVTLKDTGDNLLDRQTEMFRLGLSSGQITSFTATPRYFDIGDSIDISLHFRNTGTVSITGTAVVKVVDEDGEIVQVFTHDIAGLAPSASPSFDDVWDTSGEEEGTYTIVGYVLYDSMATDPRAAVVSTGPPEAQIYLPLILKNHQ